jgi:hypothetical protein
MDVVQLCENYPVLSNIIKGDFPLFLAPSYPANCTNGYANKDCVCLWGKPTQIPSPMTDYIIGHEFGHVIQLNYFDRYGDDKHKKLMRQYLELRHAPKGMCHIYRL